MNKVFGSMVAATVAGLVASSAVMANEPPKQETKMACQNGSCKGKASCKGFGNDTCKGHNECKGHGMTKAANEAACKKAGGTWAEVK